MIGRVTATGELVEVGRGCRAWMRLPGGCGETNIGLVAGDGASLLIDTPWDRRLTRARSFDGVACIRGELTRAA
jgi:hypothetical protein